MPVDLTLALPGQDGIRAERLEADYRAVLGAALAEAQADPDLAGLAACLRESAEAALSRATTRSLQNEHARRTTRYFYPVD